MPDALLSVTDLTIAFGDQPPVVNQLSFRLAPGEQAGLLGLSGSGKSLTALALLGLLPEGARLLSGEAVFRLADGTEIDLLRQSPRDWQKLRGRQIGLVFQEPLTALNPSQRVGKQLKEAVVSLSPELPTEAAQDEHLRNWLSRVELAAEDHDRILGAYPHELSGGQRQRLLIALALLAEPRLLIADEPTTALDVLTEAGILRLIARLRAELGMTLLFITHDLVVMKRTTDRLLVLKEGVLQHDGPTKDILALPNAGLGEIGEKITSGKSLAVTETTPVLEVDDLSIHYPGRKLFPWSSATIHEAVRNISFSVAAGEWLALIGPSGCGKTTTARHLAGLLPRTKGSVRVSGRPQLVFQDPFSSLNPRHTVRTILREVIRLRRPSPGKSAIHDIITDLLNSVGLAPATYADRLPAELSGGQRQRVAIARSLAAAPELLIADEAVSALDAPLRAEVLGLLDQLRKNRGIGLLFISHDLRLVAEWADRVLIMDQGKIVEAGPAKTVLNNPQSSLGKRLKVS